MSSSTTDADRHDAFPGRNGRIAFIHGPGLGFGQGSGDVYAMNADGTHVRRLTHFGPSFTVAVDDENWSPDGRHLVFDYVTVSNFIVHIWLMNADGTHQHPILDDPAFSDSTGSFLPGGNQVAFNRCRISNMEICAIYRVNLDGSGLKKITSLANDRQDFLQVYSPDGSKIALNSIRLGGYAAPLALMNADGSDIRPITPTKLGAIWPNWSPDGRRLVFSTYPHFAPFGENEEIWSSDASGGDLQRLTKNNFPGQRSYYAQPHDLTPAWSPRGDAIVFARRNGSFTSWGIYVLTRHGAAWTTKRLLDGDALDPDRSPMLPVKHARGAGASGLRQLESGGTVPRWGSAPDLHGPNGN